MLKVNGEVKQEGDLNQMIWRVPEMISYLSDYFSLAAGDVILSGTHRRCGAGGVRRYDGSEYRRVGVYDRTCCLTDTRQTGSGVH